MEIPIRDRRIFNSRGFLRGEIGASMVKSRIMETSLGYILDVMNGEFEELKK